MRNCRPLVISALALLLLAPAGLAQSEASMSVEAFSADTPLSEASPLEPGAPVSVTANVTTPDDGREWRLVVSADIASGENATASDTWQGQQTGQTSVDLSAPDEPGSYALQWNATLSSRQSSDEAWTVERTDEDGISFSVKEPAPDPENVTVDVRTGRGDSIQELGNLTPNEDLVIEADVELPERQRTVWNVSMRVFVDGNLSTQAQQRSDGGTVPFLLQLTAPSEEGQHELRWEVEVEYRDEAEDSFTHLTTEEGSTTFGVEPLAPEPGPGIPWLWILIGAAVVVGGGAGAYYLFRPPKQIKGEPRSQAMQDLEGGQAAAAEPEEPEVHPQVKILEARADDLRRMIELARERHEEGEITEHQFEQIKERKEAELEDVEQEIEEYRQEGGQQ